MITRSLGARFSWLSVVWVTPPRLGSRHQPSEIFVIYTLRGVRFGPCGHLRGSRNDSLVAVLCSQTLTRQEGGSGRRQEERCLWQNHPSAASSILTLPGYAASSVPSLPPAGPRRPRGGARLPERASCSRDVDRRRSCRRRHSSVWYAVSGHKGMTLRQFSEYTI
jgi:hypothetical protein